MAGQQCLASWQHWVLMPPQDKLFLVSGDVVARYGSINDVYRDNRSTYYTTRQRMTELFFTVLSITMIVTLFKSVEKVVPTL